MAKNYDETKENGEPASRVQIDNLERQIKEIKALMTANNNKNE